MYKMKVEIKLTAYKIVKFKKQLICALLIVLRVKIIRKLLQRRNKVRFHLGKYVGDISVMGVKSTAIF